ncbi:MAG: MFS transporter, partial [Planctomycetota bacterium]
MALRRDLRAIYGDGVSYSLMVGLGETYIPAFVLTLGMGEVAAGWIVSIPMMAGAILQLVSPAAVAWLKSRRRWVLFCASLQVLSLLAFMIAAGVGHCPGLIAFLLASLYWGANLATGPAWNTWVGHLVPRQIRPTFFARRSRACQAAIMIGTVAGGLCLHLGAEKTSAFRMFVVLFLAAAMSRAISTWFLARQSEPRPVIENHRIVTPLEFLHRARRGDDGRLLLYMLAVQVAVQIAGPFFTPYMLGRLEYSYLEYLVVLCTAFAAKMIAFPLAGQVARRFGSQKVLYFSGIGIVPLSALWVFSDNLVYLLFLQVLSGMIWASYELSTFLLFFERIDESDRTRVLTAFNLANAMAMVVGALIGGFLLKIFGP